MAADDPTTEAGPAPGSHGRDSEGAATVDTDLLDLLGHRWMPRIIVAFDAGAIGFNELRRRCDDMSASVLSQRLTELREAGLAVPDEFGSWEPTEAGRTLARRLVELAGADVSR